MSYTKTWHRDYAAEAIKGGERNRWSKDPNHDFAMHVLTCGQGATLALQVAREIDNPVLADIAQTVIDTITESHDRGSRCKRKITDKQQRVLAVLLLEKYGTARAIGAAIWGLTDEEIDNADV